MPACSQHSRRLVAAAKQAWRREHHRGRRPAVWSPGEHLVIDWGAEGGLHVFCAVLAWSRFRFVRFAADERAATTLALLAECFEVLGGVPGKVLADRMGCLKGGVVANIVVPTAEYVRFAGHYGFRPDFCEAADPESKPRVAYCTSSGRCGVLCCCPGGEGSGGVRHFRRAHASCAGAAGRRSLSLRPCARVGGLGPGGG